MFLLFQIQKRTQNYRLKLFTLVFRMRRKKTVQQSNQRKCKHLFRSGFLFSTYINIFIYISLQLFLDDVVIPKITTKIGQIHAPILRLQKFFEAVNAEINIRSREEKKLKDRKFNDTRTVREYQALATVHVEIRQRNEQTKTMIGATMNSGVSEWCIRAHCKTNNQNK